MDKFKNILATSLATVCLGLSISAAHADMGAGIVLGQPTGLSARVDTSERTAFDAALAWNLGNVSYIWVHADHLWIRPNAIKLDGGRGIDWYYGLGAAVALPESDVGVALRLPVGLSYRFRDPSLEVFGELAIAFTVVPDTDFDVLGGLGLRYWF